MGEGTNSAASWPPPVENVANLLLLPGTTQPGWWPPASRVTRLTAPPGPDLRAAAFDIILGEAAVPAWLPILTQALQSAGRLYLQPRLVPGTRLRGKKARQTAAAATYLNAVFAFAQPEALPAHSRLAWERAAVRAGLMVEQFTIRAEAVTFHDWAAPLTAADQTRMRALLHQVPDLAREFLTLQFSGDRITVHVAMARICLRPSSSEAETETE